MIVKIILISIGILALLIILFSIIDNKRMRHLEEQVARIPYFRNEEFMELISSIITLPKYQEMKKFKQHGKTTTYDHSLKVAYATFWFAKEHPKYDLKAMVRGALLHDYYLYDWHHSGEGHKLHGFRHPIFAYRNALRDYNLNKIERDIIRKHMFPLTFYLFPCYKESYVVSKIDKRISFLETIHRK